MSKTLGQVAEKIYLAEMSGGASPTLAFQAAAEAVVDAYDGPAHSRKSKREAVIEAAKVLRAGPWSGDGFVFWDNFKALVEAVKALDREEAR